jgi:hypothetical protein
MKAPPIAPVTGRMLLDAKAGEEERLTGGSLVLV